MSQSVSPVVSKKSSLQRTEELAKTSKDLLLGQPFYGIFLIMLNKQWNNKLVPTAGVSKNGINYQLTFNTNFWDSLTEPQRKGLVLHELGHIGHFHLTDFQSLTDTLIANLGMDIFINQYIDPALLPPGPQLSRQP